MANYNSYLQPGIAGVQLPMSPQNQALITNQRNAQTEAASRQKQLQQGEDEQNSMKMAAMHYALNNSVQLQGTNAPRTVHDTSMTISSGDGGDGGSGSASRSGTQGGFGGGGAAIDGRYMSLVAPPNPNLNTAQQPQVQRPQPDFTPQDATGYQDAAFARLKDKSGSLGKGAIDSLMAQLAGRGVGNSGVAGRGIAGEIVKAVNPLSELNVAHLGDEYNAAQHARELSEAAANTEYSGNIAQRGQNIGAQEALNNLRAQLEQTRYSGEMSQKKNQLDYLYRLL